MLQLCPNLAMGALFFGLSTCPPKCLCTCQPLTQNVRLTWTYSTKKPLSPKLRLLGFSAILNFAKNTQLASSPTRWDRLTNILSIMLEAISPTMYQMFYDISLSKDDMAQLTSYGRVLYFKAHNFLSVWGVFCLNVIFCPYKCIDSSHKTCPYQLHSSSCKMP